MLYPCVRVTALLLLAFFICRPSSRGQSVESRFFSRLDGKTAELDRQLTRQTEKYLERMARREERLKKKLCQLDTAAAKRLFSGSEIQEYTRLETMLKRDSGKTAVPLSGEYLPYVDSLKVSLSFLRKNIPPGNLPDPRLQNSIQQLQQLQSKIQDAEQIKAFIRQRKEQIKQWLVGYTQLPAGIQKEYQGINQDLYYYSRQVKGYKDVLNNPDELQRKVLSLLNQLPAFQQFMKNNSQLAGLFNLPGNYGAAGALTGLQTCSQVQQLIQEQVAAGGPGGMAALQSNVQAAEQQLDQFKDKLNGLGGGSGDIDLPDFKPNNEKTKTFLQRLEYGTNFQTTRTNTFFPTVTDLGLSVGYKLNDRSTAGIGASYKIGWGNGINHIALSGQGAGLRSFLDVKIRKTFFATGGLEYNYTTPITDLRQIRDISYWTRSGLIGVSKTVAVKGRWLKQTKIQLLWDFLSYRQLPKTQPVLFRIGYVF